MASPLLPTITPGTLTPTANPLLAPSLLSSNPIAASFAATANPTLSISPQLQASLSNLNPPAGTFGGFTAPTVTWPGNQYDPYGFAFGPTRPVEGYRPVPARQVPSANIYGVYSSPMTGATPSKGSTAGGKKTAAPSKKANITFAAGTPYPPFAALGGAGAGSTNPADIAAALKKVTDSIQPIKPGSVSYTPTSYKAPKFIDERGNVTSLLAAGQAAYNKLMAGSTADLNAYQKMVQNLPNLTGPALQQAIQMLQPQIQAALQGGVNQSTAIQALGKASSDLQQKIGANVSNAYNSSGQLLSALSSALGGTVAGALNQGLAAVPSQGAPSALAAGVAPGGMALSQLAPGAAGGLTALRGTIPAVGLAGQGLNAQQATQDQALTLLGGAGNLASSALAAANQKASDIGATLPQQEQQIYQQLSTERSQNLDRELSVLQQKGQITASEADAVKAMYTAQAQAYSDYGTQRNAFNVQNAGTTAQIAGQNADRQMQAQMDNAQLAISAASANTSKTNAAISQWLSIYKLMNPTGTTALSAANQAKYSTQMGNMLNSFLPTKGKQTVTKGTNAQDQPTKKTEFVGGKAAAPIANAWKQFLTSYGNVPGLGGPPGLLQIFKSFMNIPAGWTEANVENNFGPLMTVNGRTVSGKIRNAGKTWQIGNKMMTAQTQYAGGDALLNRGGGGANAATTAFRTSTPVPFSGVTTQGINPDLLSRISNAAAAVGATGIQITSGKRAPGPGNDVANSNHITGNAMDGYAIINGKKIPLGTALKSVAAQYGLRSGDVANFDPRTPGGYDPVHVDDAANQPGGILPLPYTGQLLNATTLPYTGGNLNTQQLQDLWIQAGGSPSLAGTMAAIAMAESHGNPSALNNNPATGDYSVGPWQINYYGNMLPSRTAQFGSPQALQSNPLMDAAAAVALANSPGGLSNWSTYKSGAYKQYL